MFGGAYFGKRYFGGRYFGPIVSEVILPAIRSILIKVHGKFDILKSTTTSFSIARKVHGKFDIKKTVR